MRLPELQSSLRSALLGESSAELLGCIEADEISAEERLSIYRNTISGTLEKALRLNFPAVHKLVGDDFFAHCAAEFVHLAPPHSAYLNDFGAGFPDFLARDERAATLSYLGDVAKLEWAVSRALVADARPVPDWTQLAGLDAASQAQVRFTAHPSVTLLELHSPADLIWQAVLAGDEATMASLELDTAPVYLLIERLGLDLSVRRLANSEWQFAKALCSGAPLGEVLASESGVDAQGQLALHLGSGRVSGWQISAAQTTTIS